MMQAQRTANFGHAQHGTHVAPQFGRSAAADGRQQSRWRIMRHPVRVVAMTIAALALSWSLVGTQGAVPAGLGAAAGVVLGEWLGRGKLKLQVVLGGAVAALCFAWLLAVTLTSTAWLASGLGPGLALGLSVVLRFGAAALFPVLALRAMAVRRPGLVALELIVVVAALSVLFSAHRGGVISRPFWLSDWAWRADVDPAYVLLAIGGGAVVLLALLMITETGRQISWISVLALPAVAALLMSFLNLTGLPKPKSDSDLGLTEESDKETRKQSLPAQEPDDGRGNKDKDKDKENDGNQGPKPPPSGSGAASAKPDDKDKDGQKSSESDPDKDKSDGKRNKDDEDEDEGPSSQQGQTPLAIVLLGDDYSPPLQMYYFRQDVLSHYNGMRLVAANRSDVDRDAVTEFPTRKIELQQPPKKSRKLVRARVALLTEHTKPFGLEAPIRFAPWSNPNPQRFVRSYRFEALAVSVDYGKLLGRKVGNPKWSKAVKDYYVVPSKDPRFAKLAKEIVAKLPPDKQKDLFLNALAIKLWMDKALTYSTRERHANATDPTADFLFGNRIGYCVHFAHAAVYLWRSLGIPSRIGAGYATTEDDREGSSIMINSGDGHAWPELYIEGVGWTVLDISAERNLDPIKGGADKELQRRLSELAREKPPGGDDPDLGKRRWRLPAFWKVLAVLLGATLLVLYSIKLWRRLAPRFAGRRRMTRVGYRLALDWLSENGLQRALGEPREQFARRVASALPSFERLTRLHLAAYWGNPAVAMDQREEFDLRTWKTLLAQLHREVRNTTKTHKRMLNALNPASFVWSR